MKLSGYFRFPLSLAGAAVLLTGCLATTSPQPETAAPKPVPEVVKEAPRPVEKVRSPEEIALGEGIALYNNGDFNGAVKKLGTIVNAEKPIQLQAYKYMAFSYCVSNRQTLCKQQFDKALKLDPTFNLEPGERGHPLWGPVFQRARKGK